MGSEIEGKAIVSSETSKIQGMIYTLRGDQAMLDSDLAALYGVETGALNRAASRNAKRFPSDFRFQLTAEELGALRCQTGTSNAAEGRGGRRYLPYAYTEQGIAMLSSVLRSETAIDVSVRIVRAFVEMRRFLASNAAMFERMSALELKQRATEGHLLETDEKIEQIFGRLEARAEPVQAVYFEGQVYDALEFLCGLVAKAEREVVLVDGYVGLGTLNVLRRKREGVRAELWAKKQGDKLAEGDVVAFNEQYKGLAVHHTDAFHDRFLILDGAEGYHIGASVKDAGKRGFAVTRLLDDAMVGAVLERLKG